MSTATEVSRPKISGLVRNQPGLTIAEILSRLEKAGHPISRQYLYRLFADFGIVPIFPATWPATYPETALETILLWYSQKVGWRKRLVAEISQKNFPPARRRRGVVKAKH